MGITLKELELVLRDLYPPRRRGAYGWISKVETSKSVKRIAVCVDLRKLPRGYDAAVVLNPPSGTVPLPVFAVGAGLDPTAELVKKLELEPQTRRGEAFVVKYDGSAFLTHLKERLGVYPLRHHLPFQPRRVMLLAGCGFKKEVIDALREEGAQALVSGDLTYPAALRLMELKVGYADLGCYTSLKFAPMRLAKRLEKLMPEGVEVEFLDWGEV